MKSTKLEIREIHYNLICPYCKYSEYFGSDSCLEEDYEDDYICSACKKQFKLKKDKTN